MIVKSEFLNIVISREVHAKQLHSFYFF